MSCPRTALRTASLCALYVAVGVSAFACSLNPHGEDPSGTDSLAGPTLPTFNAPPSGDMQPGSTGATPSATVPAGAVTTAEPQGSSTGSPMAPTSTEEVSDPETSAPAATASTPPMAATGTEDAAMEPPPSDGETDSDEPGMEPGGSGGNDGSSAESDGGVTANAEPDAGEVTIDNFDYDAGVETSVDAASR